jgi:SAM-dependent methyltransferase
VVRAALPLAVRKRVAVWLGAQSWLAARHWWTRELLRDFAERDPDGYHRFLWSHHLAYAETYEAERRFGVDNIHPTRRLLFDELRRCLADQDVVPERDVAAVLEVGCSLGYLLRELETGLFRGAATLDGIDLDARAIAVGQAWLAAAGSRVRLMVGDMAALATLVGDRRYDVVLCAGTLMYLREAPAAEVVAAMLRRTRRLLVLAGLAHPERDNAELTASAVRERDGTFIHNLDAMVARAGGRVARRRWDGPRMVDGNTIYFVLAAPPAGVTQG